MKIRCGGLFSGIGGFSIAAEAAGMESVFEAEKDANCRKLLAAKFPGTVIFEDVCEVGAHNLPKIDVLCGGSPCQGFSVAGLRGGMEDGRSNLAFQFCRIADEIHPAITLFENVPGLLSMSDNSFGNLIAALVGEDSALEPGPRPDPGKRNRWWRWSPKLSAHIPAWPNAGLAAGPKRTAAWRVLDAQHFGLAQRRKRVFIVASPRAELPSKILFERKILCGNYPQSSEEGQEIAGTLGGGSGRRGWCDDTDRTTFVCRPVAHALYGHAAKGGDPTTDNYVTAFSSKDDGGDAGPIAPTLRSMNFKDSHINGGGQIAIAFKPSHFTRGKDGAPGEVTPPLSADADKGDQEAVVACFDERQVTSKANRSQCKPDVAGTSNQTPHSVATATAVRRLTPVECERLQGFSVDHTAGFADSVRYRMLGNAVAVPVAAFILRRIAAALS